MKIIHFKLPLLQRKKAAENSTAFIYLSKEIIIRRIFPRNLFETL